VIYRDLPVEEYATVLTGFGLSAATAAAVADGDRGIGRGDLTTESGDLRRLIGRPTATLAQAVRAGLNADLSNRPHGRLRRAQRRARHRLNRTLITQHWDDLLRVASSLKMGTIGTVELMRSLQGGSRPSALARAIGELGRIPKTLHLLSVYDSPLDYSHVNLLGRYHFTLPDAIARGELRPLRDLAARDEHPPIRAVVVTAAALSVDTSPLATEFNPTFRSVGCQTPSFSPRCCSAPSPASSSTAGIAAAP